MPSKLTSLLVLFFLFKGLSSQTAIDKYFSKADLLHTVSYEQTDSLYDIVEGLNLTERETYQLYFSRSELNIYWGLYEKALQNIEEAIQLSETLMNDTLRVKALILKGNVLLDLGMIDKSVELYLKTIEEVEASGKSKLLSMLYGGIAEIYRITDQLKYALSYNSKALAIAKKSSNEDEWARVYNNLSATLGELGENTRAIDTLKKALTLISDSNFYAEAKYYSNIGFSFRNMSLFDSALFYHKKALRLKIKHKYSNTIWYSYSAIGRAFLGLEQKDSALYFLDLGFKYAKQFSNVYNLRDAHIHLATALASNEEYKRAYEILEKGKFLEDSLYEADYETKINLYQKKYDVAKKEQELSRLKLSQLLEKEQHKSQQQLLFGLLISVVLLAIIFGLLLKRRAQEKQIIAIKYEQSQNELVENKNRLKEFAHELADKNQAIFNLNKSLLEKTSQLDKKEEISAIQKEKLTSLKILTESDWTKFKVLFERVYPKFFDHIRDHQLNFTKGEKRILALIKLNLNNQEAANLLGISSESVSKSKSRLKKKLESINIVSIESFISQF